MEDNRLLEIWRVEKQRLSSENQMSLDAIAAFREEFSEQTSIAASRILRFDTLFKSSVALLYAILFFLGGIEMLKSLLSAFAVAGMIFLASENRSRQKRLSGTDDSKEILSVLRLKKAFLKKSQSIFVITSSITYTLLVLAGFQFYQFFKYGEQKLTLLLKDPVIWLFLAAAFLIPWITQKMNGSKELEDLSLLIFTIDDNVEAETGIRRIRKRRSRRITIYSVIILIGLAMLAVGVYLIRRGG